MRKITCVNFIRCATLRVKYQGAWGACGMILRWLEMAFKRRVGDTRDWLKVSGGGKLLALGGRQFWRGQVEGKPELLDAFGNVHEPRGIARFNEVGVGA
jgi:hypothetical protein